jgi:hypothetical protein
MKLKLESKLGLSKTKDSKFPIAHSLAILSILLIFKFSAVEKGFFFPRGMETVLENLLSFFFGFSS